MISLLLTFSLVLFVLFCLCFCLFVFGCVIQYSEYLSHFPDICSPFLCSWSRDNNELYLVHIWNHFYFYKFVNVSKAENWIYVARFLTCGAHLQYIESIEYIEYSEYIESREYIAMIIVTRFLACGTNLQLPKDWPALLKGWHRYSESNLRFMKSIWDHEICITISKNQYQIHFINKINLELIISVWDLKFAQKYQYYPMFSAALCSPIPLSWACHAGNCHRYQCYHHDHHRSRFQHMLHSPIRLPPPSRSR